MMNVNQTGVIKWLVMPFVLLALVLCSSCSESDGETDNEFTNWKSKNDSFMEDLEQQYQANPTAWVKLKKNLQDKVVVVKSDEPTTKVGEYVYAQVLKNGTGTQDILYTDSVAVHYLGCLIPTEKHPDGYVFDQSFSGESWADFNEHVALPTKFAVNSLVTGFSTVLQVMHVGDTWKVYIPYQLGYGSSDSGVIPAFSTLIFYMKVAAVWHVDESHPDFQSRAIEW